MIQYASYRVCLTGHLSRFNLQSQKKCQHGKSTRWLSLHWGDVDFSLYPSTYLSIYIIMISIGLISSTWSDFELLPIPDRNERDEACSEVSICKGDKTWHRGYHKAYSPHRCFGYGRGIYIYETINANSDSLKV